MLRTRSMLQAVARQASQRHACASDRLLSVLLGTHPRHVPAPLALPSNGHQHDQHQYGHSSGSHASAWDAVARRTLHTSSLCESPAKEESGSQTASNEEGVAEAEAETEAPAKSQGWLAKLFSPERVVASPSFTNRWLMTIPAFATHLCIGSPYAWSVMSGFVSKENGFVAAAASDWTFNDVTYPMSIIFLLQGVSAAVAAKWCMRVGARAAMTVAGFCFGGGLIIGSAGIAIHSLPLLYAGYGVLAGCGIGIAYTPPVQALIEWFPDRKGIASGLTIAGFGSGALVFGPASQWLCNKFATAPEFLGKVSELSIVNKDGALFADGGSGQLREVVVANASEIAKLPWHMDLAEGVYAVGTGSTGAAQALFVCGTAYLGIMVASAFAIRRPAPGYVPAGWEPPKASDNETTAAGPGGNVSVDTVMKTPQFAALSAVFFSVACGGLGLMSVAKPMMADVFSSSLPAIVTSSFAGSYVMGLAAGNLGGRIGWATVSDKVGRKAIFNMFTLGSIPLYLGIPWLVDATVGGAGSLPMYGFVASTIAAVSFMGGVYAIMPAYEADLFGSKYVGAIHGRFLLASSAAAVAGPAILLKLRQMSESSAVDGLLQVIEPKRFEAAFGATMDQVQPLVEAKTVTIAKLLELAPPGTMDPTPMLYHSTMYTMAGFMALAAIAHQFVKPVAPRYFEVEASTNGAEADSKKAD